jgi:hypothetical protein
LPFVAIAIMSGCEKQLDLKPTNDLTADDVYKTSAGYKQALAKVYGAMALTGNSGGAGSPDIPSQIILMKVILTFCVCTGTCNA